MGTFHSLLCCRHLVVSWIDSDPMRTLLALEASSQIPEVALKQGKKYGTERKRELKPMGTADLWAGCFVVRRSQPHCGDAPSSRLASSPNLWPRHPRLFVSWLLLVLACLCSAEATSYPDGPAVGEVAPALKVSKWLQAPPEAGSGWPSNKVVVLDFWATWCGPCVGAIPHLNELVEGFKDKPVQFIAVTDQDESVIQSFLKKTPIHAWIGLSADAASGEDRPYRIYGIPHAVVIDAHGRIAAVIDPRALTSEMIETCLADKPLPQANEPGGETAPGVVPGQYRLGKSPLFQVLIRPISRTNQVETWGDGGLTFQPCRLEGAICRVFDITRSRVVAETPLPQKLYEFYITLPWVNGNPQGKERLQTVFAQAVDAAFGLSVKKEMREMDVFVLRTNATSAEKLTKSSNEGGKEMNGWGEVTGTDRTLLELTGGLEYAISKPVVDETGLSGRYSYCVKWDQKDVKHPNPEGMAAAVKKLGLELVETKKSLEVVVVKAATEQKPIH
ncbi:MAG: hypothetical protein JWR26_3346 [Pedosphaera sp.]|nr:hypothetical protein [Pedosphaera sp.]